MAAATKSTLLAVDTNLLLDLDANAALSRYALELIRPRLSELVIFECRGASCITLRSSFDRRFSEGKFRTKSFERYDLQRITRGC
jgi:hypothetical protein